MVVVVEERPQKRMKQRATAEMYDFMKFPAPEEESSGAFRSKIGGFLTKHARPPPPCSLFPHLMVWQISFRIGDLMMMDGQDLTTQQDVVTLDIIEEDVTRSKSIYCDQCRVIGWSGHPVCRKRYHFLIRKNGNSPDVQQKICSTMHVSDPRCISCNSVAPEDDIENWVERQLVDPSHLLHGVVHLNGYGHLLRVNGKEGGSEVLSGCDIMKFWDRLCKILGVRKISVMDVSKKYGLEYRLLHAVTDGHPWYGDWGYEFCNGSFGLNHEAYQKAVKTLSEIPLSLFYQSRAPRTQLQNVITFYQSLSETELTTTRDLFSFLVELVQNAHEPSQTVNCSSKGSSLWLCTWTRGDIERVEQSLIKVLRAVGGSRWVSWRALKGAVRGVASAELVDHCLKEIGGKAVDGMMVLSRCNHELDAIEYRLVLDSAVSTDQCASLVNSSLPTKEHVLRDVKFLYDALLYPTTMFNYKPKTVRENAAHSARVLLDCKQFVKEYRCLNSVMSPFAIQVSCPVDLRNVPLFYTYPPPEIMTFPLNATMGNLIIETAKAYQEMYILLDTFEVDDVVGYETVRPSAQLRYLIGTAGTTITLRGRVHVLEGLEQFRMERGTDNWIVECSCGATDDDGERMLSCDKCYIWLHTRCSGIDDFDPVPLKFICSSCRRLPKKSTKRSIPKKSGGKLTRTPPYPLVTEKGCAKKGMGKASAKPIEARGKHIGKFGLALAKVSGKYSTTGGKSTDDSSEVISFQEDSVVTSDFNIRLAEQFEAEGQENSKPKPKPFLSNSESIDKVDKNIFAAERFETKGHENTKLGCSLESFEEDKKEIFAVWNNCSFKSGSAGSGTGSECIDDTLAEPSIDTCSSQLPYVRHSESGWKCKDEAVDAMDSCSIVSGLKVCAEVPA